MLTKFTDPQTNVTHFFKKLNGQYSIKESTAWDFEECLMYTAKYPGLVVKDKAGTMFKRIGEKHYIKAKNARMWTVWKARKDRLNSKYPPYRIVEGGYPIKLVMPMLKDLNWSIGSFCTFFQRKPITLRSYPEYCEILYKDISIRFPHGIAVDRLIKEVLLPIEVIRDPRRLLRVNYHDGETADRMVEDLSGGLVRYAGERDKEFK